ncbi:ferritin [Antrihabitans sp. YC2-6]|uniref:ferritin n=1 Tax=Antrihabitans sp. YC2-6 TaxID=2799498 RepID=UPI0018F44A01|nr:ferritin [Antrihabitans sp. YC2-6]MBJ8346317.1 ferritin [Antrihabitans sp. YC2-6]
MPNRVTQSDSAFHKLLREQIRHEFTASQQYVAIAVYFDTSRLPQLAQRFYLQATEEREHALMMVQYLLDRDLEVSVGGLDEVTPSFESIRGAVEHARSQEQDVTDKITELTRTARETGDYLGEQFMGWFLEAQVQEVASMNTLLAVIDRAAGNTFDIEEFVARELRTPTRAAAPAPRIAGAARQ